ncbi:deoxyribodipyrimidine photolyase-related protein [Streptomyces sp. 1222.5]|uniref:cryptochrome/photolyase family protein n=1 Tax=unclassified Streptomyces TaxID=2593676 RepID=UPI00089783F5|nr:MULTISPECIES: cryptochrome/photolyase family protein [unclassified Streptomyces]PKW05425.1 deoxyribodipyrimidine photolyase-related protein [Streptomyces sp. 5112.2]SED40015.1 deoxyribodipyrimidine photolyase-related protein [Streptomyces sp. 1222.5]
MTDWHWLFGDQLGPHFLAPGDGGPARNAGVVMIEARSVFRRRRFHRAKAHLVLSAMRHRAAELGDRVRYVRAETYREGLRKAIGDAPVTVHHPTSRAALRLVDSLDQARLLPARGFLLSQDAFRAWAGEHDRGRLRQEDFYHWVRHELDLLMDGDSPVGGRWNHDHANREPPPKGARALGAPKPYRPREDHIDDEVRADLDQWEDEGIRFVGRDGPRRFPASRREALSALRRFTEHRLAGFGPHEDAMLAGDPVMSHSLLSSSLNLGLLDPAECVTAAEDAWRAGRAPVHSVEGFVRQVAGWREYVWQLYWYFGEDYRRHNAPRHHAPLPEWFLELDADAVSARCLATVLAQVRDTGWTHHIPRLMLLGSFALQRGWDPREVTDWFHRCFVDGYDWVMLPNVTGMSQYADGGRMTTKPYTSGGAYIHRMSDLCDGCVYRPGDRTGERACPFTTGYWSFVHRHRALLSGNMRTFRAVQGLDRLGDLEEVLRTERGRGEGPP